MSATTVPASGPSGSIVQGVTGKEQSSRSSRKREKSHPSSNGQTQMETEHSVTSTVESEPKKAKTVPPSPGGVTKPSIHDIFKTLEYGPAPEAPNVAEAWLDDHKRSFGHFINGKWYTPEGKRNSYESRNSVNGSRLATTIQGSTEDMELAVNSAKIAYDSWSKLPPHVRARHMYSIARHVQKHSRLISVLESMDNGKPIRESRDLDIPLVVRHLYHYSGWAQLMDTEMKGWTSLGVVAGIVPWNFPLMLLTWKVCPALAMGNTVVLKPATYTRLTALLFAEVCTEAGLPPGVFNVVTGNGAFGQELACHPLVDKVAFTGSTEVGQILRQATAGTGKRLSLELGGKSPMVVFDTADVDSAVEGVVDAIWLNQGQVCSAGSRLLVQETIADKMVIKLKDRMSHLRLGDSLDKGVDMGAIVDPAQRRSVETYVERARQEGAEVYQACASIPSKGCFYPPTLITNVQPVSKVVQEEIFGPVLSVLTFRTPKEAIALANNTVYGLASSVWTENISLALEVALNLKAGACWINCYNMFDAAAGFGGYRESGFGRDGGKEGLYDYVRPVWQKPVCPEIDEEKVQNFGSNLAPRPLNPSQLVQGYPTTCTLEDQEVPAIDRTYKMYIGGAQKRPDAPYARPVIGSKGQVLGQVGEGNRKDVRDAVECAFKAWPGWGKRAAHNRAQIVYYLAENLELRRTEFAQRISDMTGDTLEDALAEVDCSIRRLFHWGAYADKYGGGVQETLLYGATVKIHEPVGVIGIACPMERPLLGFVSLFAPAVIRGNTIVIVPSERYPLSANDLYQVFDTSDLPGGVVNIITGSQEHITKYLVEHQNVEAMWYFGSAEGSKFVEQSSINNVKRTWVNYGAQRDWMDPEQGEGEEFLIQATEVKNIWIPMGEIFAN